MTNSTSAGKTATLAIVQDMAKDTKVSTPKLKEVKVKINANLVVVPDANAYFKEIKRLNPASFNALEIEDGNGGVRPLEASDLVEYFKGILKIRIECLTDEGTKNWKKAKLLNVPAKLELAISLLGIITIRECGIRMIPTFDHEYDMEHLLRVSDALEAFASDGLYLFKDAFPRTVEGNAELFNFIQRDGVVFGKTKDLPPAIGYVAGYLGLELVTLGYDNNYLVPYETIDYIKESYRAERRLVCSI